MNNSDIRTLINMTSQLSLAISEVDVEYGESLERIELVIKKNLERIKKNVPDIVEGLFILECPNSARPELLCALRQSVRNCRNFRLKGI